MPIYLDNNSTTQLDPEVLEAMLEEMRGGPANPSSPHLFGQRARRLLQGAREKVASFFGVLPEEILFTSGGSEGVNTLLRGLPLPSHLITSNVEHAAVYQTLQELSQKGLIVTYLPAGAQGAPSPEEVEAAITPKTSALFFSACNSETGVKIDVAAIAAIATKHRLPLYLDAVSWIGKEPFPLFPSIAGFAFSAHKFHGPKGVGGLLLRSSSPYTPLITGGKQERGRRAGTENLAGILGLAKAIDILSKRQGEITSHLSHLRKRFEEGLLAQIPHLEINGKGERICNTVNLFFPGIDAETLLIQLDLSGIAASQGSACSSGGREPSRILSEMGLGGKRARSSVRFSIGRMNTSEEIEQAISVIPSLVSQLSSL